MITTETRVTVQVSEDLWKQINEFKLKAMELESRRVKAELSEEEQNKLMTLKCFLISYEVDVEELVDLYSV